MKKVVRVEVVIKNLSQDHRDIRKSNPRFSDDKKGIRKAKHGDIFIKVERAPIWTSSRILGNPIVIEKKKKKKFK